MENTKSESKHTPGPWSFRASERTNRKSILWDSDGRILGEVETNDLEGESNARLIAAAPELLDACERIIREIKAGTSLNLDHLGPKMALAAISKAKGE